MTKLSLFIMLLALSSRLATAQQIETTRLLTPTYQAQPLEQALCRQLTDKCSCRRVELGQ